MLCRDFIFFSFLTIFLDIELTKIKATQMTTQLTPHPIKPKAEV